MVHSEEQTEQETVETGTPQEDHSQEQEELTKQRWKQQMEGKQQQLEKTRQIAFDAQVKLAEQSVDNLLELEKTDPQLAKEVALYFNFKSVQEAKKRALEKTKPVEPKETLKEVGLTEDDFQKRYQEMRQKEKHEEAIQLANELFDELPKGAKEQAKEYFDELIEGKQLDISKVKKFAEMATLYASKSQSKKDDGLSHLASTQISSSKASKPSERKVDIDDNGRLIYID